MENEQLTKDFLDFLDLYQSENYAEHLHNALYYVSQEVTKHDLADDVISAIYHTRYYLNQLVEHLPEPSSVPKKPLVNA